MSHTWRELLEMSATAEYNYLVTGDEKYLQRARAYLDRAEAMPR